MPLVFPSILKSPRARAASSSSLISSAYELDHDTFVDEQLREIRRNPRIYRYYLEAAHNHLQRDGTLLALHNLPDPRLRQILRETALHHAATTRSVEAANDLLILASAERFFAGDVPDDAFYTNATNFLNKFYPEFTPVLQFRHFEQQLRYTAANHDLLMEATEHLRVLGDLNNYYDCVRRIAENYLFIGDVDTAEAMLLSALRDLLSRGYVTEPRIRHPQDDPHSSQIALLCRALTRVNIEWAKLEGSYGAKVAAIAKAHFWNRRAHQIYQRIAEPHGVASTFREKGEIAQQCENLGEIKYSESWTYFLRAAELFRKAGDPHHEVQCRQLVIDAIGTIAVGQRTAPPGVSDEILEKSLRGYHGIQLEAPSALEHWHSPTRIGKNNKSGYTRDAPSPKSAVIQQPPMGEPSEEIDRLAGHLPEAARTPFKQKVWRDFEMAAAIAERGASADQIAAAFADHTLAELQDRFEERLREIELPEGGFTTKEQAQAAGAFAKTFRDLEERETELGLPVRKKPERVKEAQRMVTDYYRYHTETGELIPRRPRGRPRRAGAEPQAGSIKISV